MTRFIALALFLLPTAAAVVLRTVAPQNAPAATPPPRLTLEPVEISASEELEALFNAIGFAWPPDDGGYVPPVAVTTLPNDFDALSVTQRKALFFRTLAPLVAAENRRIREQRELLLDAFENGTLADGELMTRIQRIAARYNVPGNVNDPATRRRLLQRVDVVPAALVLAQAANESGWGTSRFAQEANNLFGMWTWDRSRGIEPRERAANASHYVRVFENLQEAVANYLHTINVGNAYSQLRQLRAQARQKGEALSPSALAAGLSRYSARGEAYVTEIRSIIRVNELDQLPPLVLQSEQDALAP